MAKLSRRKQKKRAQTNQRLGRLYTPHNRFNRMLQIKSVDIDPHNRYYMEMLTTAEFNLFQLNKFLWNRVELEAVDVDTLKWLTGNEFLKIVDKIRDLGRFDPGYYKKADRGEVMNIIAKSMDKSFRVLNHESGHKIIWAFHQVIKDLQSTFNKYKGKIPKNAQPFVAVTYKERNS